MGFDEGAQIYNDKTHPAHGKVKTTVDACRAALEARENGVESSVQPPSEVLATMQQGLMNYYDVGFLGEADITHYFGLPSKALSLKLVSRPREDGSGYDQGIYISLRDLDVSVGELLSIRKTRVWSSSETSHHEALLTRGDQLCAEQGPNTYQYVRKAETDDRPEGLRWDKLYTMASLKEKAARIISAREAQEKPEEVQGSGSAVVNLEDDGAAPVLGSIAKQRQMQQEPSKKQPKKRATRKTADPDGARVDSPARSRQAAGAVPGAGKSSSQAASTRPAKTLEPEASAAFKKADPDLHEVVLRLGYIPDCFHNLVIHKCFTLKMGRSLFQAGLQFIFIPCFSCNS